MTDLSNTTLHLYRNQVIEWFAAPSLEECVVMARNYQSEVVGMADEDMDLEFVQEPDDKPLTLVDEDDGSTETKTAVAWAAENGRGFFMTTEY